MEEQNIKMSFNKAPLTSSKLLQCQLLIRKISVAFRNFVLHGTWIICLDGSECQIF